jgi:hypothetical protein
MVHIHLLASGVCAGDVRSAGSAARALDVASSAARSKGGVVLTNEMLGSAAIDNLVAFATTWDGGMKKHWIVYNIHAMTAKDLELLAQELAPKLEVDRNVLIRVYSPIGCDVKDYVRLKETGAYPSRDRSVPFTLRPGRYPGGGVAASGARYLAQPPAHAGGLFWTNGTWSGRRARRCRAAVRGGGGQL